MHGFESSALRQVARGKNRRTHIYAANSLTPYWQTAIMEGEGWLAALHGNRPVSGELAELEVSSTKSGAWTLRSNGVADWINRHPALTAV